MFDFGTGHGSGFGVAFDGGHGIIPNNGEIGFYYDNQGATSNITGNDDTWYHVAVTRDDTSGDTSLYIDGALTATVNVPSPSIDATNPLAIGGEAKSGGRGWDGNLDDFGMFDQMLLPGQVAAIGNVAAEAELELDLGEMAELIDLFNAGSGSGQEVMVDDLVWKYNDSPTMASLGAGEVLIAAQGIFINFDGNAGVSFQIPEPHTGVLLSLGMLAVDGGRRRRRKRIAQSASCV